MFLIFLIDFREEFGYGLEEVQDIRRSFELIQEMVLLFHLVVNLVSDLEFSNELQVLFLGGNPPKNALFH